MDIHDLPELKDFLREVLREYVVIPLLSGNADGGMTHGPYTPGQSTSPQNGSTPFMPYLQPASTQSNTPQTAAPAAPAAPAQPSQPTNTSTADSLTKSATSIVGSLGDFASGISQAVVALNNFNDANKAAENTLKSIASSARRVPGVGAVAGGVIDQAVIGKKALDTTAKQGFGGGDYPELNARVQRAGTDLGTLSKELEKSSGTLNTFGRNQNEVSKNLLDTAEQMQTLDLGKQLKDYSNMSAKELGDYAGIVGRNSKAVLSETAEREKLARAGTELAFEMDAVSRLTGLNRESMAEEIKKRQESIDGQIAYALMTKEQQENYNSLQATLAPLGSSINTAIQEMMGGSLVNQENINTMNALGGKARSELQSATEHLRTARTQEDKDKARQEFEQAKQSIFTQMGDRAALERAKAPNPDEVTQAYRKVLGETTAGRTQQEAATREAAATGKPGATPADIANQSAVEIGNAQRGLDREGRALEGQQLGIQLNKGYDEARANAAGLATSFDALNKSIGRTPGLVDDLNKTLSFVFGGDRDPMKANTNVTPEKLQAEINKITPGGGPEPGTGMSAWQRLHNPDTVTPQGATGGTGTGGTGTGGQTAYDRLHNRSTGSLGMTGNYMEDFGAGTPMMLHGREGVITEAQFNELLGKGVTGGGSNNASTTAPTGTSVDLQQQVSGVLAKFENTLPKDIPNISGKMFDMVNTLGTAVSDATGKLTTAGHKPDSPIKKDGAPFSPDQMKTLFDSTANQIKATVPADGKIHSIPHDQAKNLVDSIQHQMPAAPFGDPKQFVDSIQKMVPADGKVHAIPPEQAKHLIDTMRGQMPSVGNMPTSQMPFGDPKQFVDSIQKMVPADGKVHAIPPEQAKHLIDAMRGQMPAVGNMPFGDPKQFVDSIQKMVPADGKVHAIPPEQAKHLIDTMRGQLPSVGNMPTSQMPIGDPKQFVDSIQKMVPADGKIHAIPPEQAKHLIDTMRGQMPSVGNAAPTNDPLKFGAIQEQFKSMIPMDGKAHAIPPDQANQLLNSMHNQFMASLPDDIKAARGQIPAVGNAAPTNDPLKFGAIQEQFKSMIPMDGKAHAIPPDQANQLLNSMHNQFMASLPADIKAARGVSESGNKTIVPTGDQHNADTARNKIMSASSEFKLSKPGQSNDPRIQHIMDKAMSELNSGTGLTDDTRDMLKLVGPAGQKFVESVDKASNIGPAVGKVNDGLATAATNVGNIAPKEHPQIDKHLNDLYSSFESVTLPGMDMLPNITPAPTSTLKSGIEDNTKILPPPQVTTRAQSSDALELREAGMMRTSPDEVLDIDTGEYYLMSVGDAVPKVVRDDAMPKPTVPNLDIGLRMPELPKPSEVKSKTATMLDGVVARSSPDAVPNLVSNRPNSVFDGVSPAMQMLTGVDKKQPEIGNTSSVDITNPFALPKTSDITPTSLFGDMQKNVGGLLPTASMYNPVEPKFDAKLTDSFLPKSPIVMPSAGITPKDFLSDKSLGLQTTTKAFDDVKSTLPASNMAPKEPVDKMSAAFDKVLPKTFEAEKKPEPKSGFDSFMDDIGDGIMSIIPDDVIDFSKSVGSGISDMVDSIFPGDVVPTDMEMNALKNYDLPIPGSSPASQGVTSIGDSDGTRDSFRSFSYMPSVDELNSPLAALQLMLGNGGMQSASYSSPQQSEPQQPPLQQASIYNQPVHSTGGKSLDDLYDIMSQVNMNIHTMVEHTAAIKSSTKESAQSSGRIPGVRSI